MNKTTNPSSDSKREIKTRLKNITKNDHKFLYQLLKERDPRANISHRKMPTFNEHVKFVTSKPYTKWYLIYHNNKKAGSIYLSKQDEIGLFLKKDMQGKNIGSEALILLLKNNSRPRYLANVAPKNDRSIKFFKKNCFKLIQYTYEFNISFGK